MFKITEKQIFYWKKTQLFFLIAVSFVFMTFITSASNLLEKSRIYPFSVYGSDIEFDVFRKGEKIGLHKVTFSTNKENLLVHCQLALKIDFLFLTAFSYSYESNSIWRDGNLKYLKASVNDDGDFFSFEAYAQANEIKIKKKSSLSSIQLPIFPTNHWNPNVLKQKIVLNTLTGELNNVSITAKSVEEVNTEAGKIDATRYVYSGDLKTEVWYDNAGRWVKMRFKGRDNTTITYKCKRCQGQGNRGLNGRK